jgi:SAM-dependent methyltransferase
VIPDPEAARHASLAPSPWIVRHAHLIPPGARVLDLACGFGRHARLFARRGAHVLAVDRDAAALATMDDVAGIETRRIDIEASGWPFGRERFDAIVSPTICIGQRCRTSLQASPMTARCSTRHSPAATRYGRPLESRLPARAGRARLSLTRG